MAPLLGEWLKPLSNFKHKKPPTQALWPGELQKLKCNHSAYAAMCSETLCKFFTFDEQSVKHLSTLLLKSVQ